MKCIHAIAPDPEPDPPPPPEGGGGGNTAPVLTLLGSASIEIWSPSNNPFKGGAWHKFHEPGYTAIDAEDGDLRGSVAVLGPTLISSGGPKNCREKTYELVYSVSDSGGLSDGPDTRTVLHHKCHGP